MRLALHLASLLLTATTPLPAPEDSSVLLGFLDYYHGAVSIGVAFEKSAAGWRLVDLQKSVVWTVAFDGKSLGQLTSRPVNAELFGDEKRMHLPLDKHVPVIGGETEDFRGWGGKAYRPLVLVSKPYFRDGDHWMRQPYAVSASLVEAFRKDTANVMNCTSPEVNKGRHFSFTDEHVLLVKSYVANSGGRIVGLILDPSLYHCDGPEPREWTSHWYYLPASDVMPHLLGTSMMPLDAGDYDNNGRSEFVFKITRYNEDGYKLFWDEFTKSLEYTWHYH